MRVLGIDPGTALTGYGVIDVMDGDMQMVAYGVIRTTNRDDPPRRLQLIFEELNELIERY